VSGDQIRVLFVKKLIYFILNRIAKHNRDNRIKAERIYSALINCYHDELMLIGEIPS